MKKPSKSGNSKTGKKTKSPKLRHHLQREANKQDITASPSTCNAGSMNELLRDA